MCFKYVSLISDTLCPWRGILTVGLVAFLLGAGLSFVSGDMWLGQSLLQMVVPCSFLTSVLDLDSFPVAVFQSLALLSGWADPCVLPKELDGC